MPSVNIANQVKHVRSLRILLWAVVVSCGSMALGQSTPEVVGQSQDVPSRINHLIGLRWDEREVKPADSADDATLVRRLYLDLAGRIPTPEEQARYLEATEPDKYDQLVNELLASEDYAVHFADTFDTLLMGRGSKQDYEQRQSQGWLAYLQRAFRDNRPWDLVAREILLARPTNELDQGSVWFLYERKNKHQAIAEAIGPAFFGTRIECAQCHDHPLCAEIEQQHYWGLVAFYRRGSNVNTKNGPRIAESAIGGFEQYADISGDTYPNVLSMLDSAAVEEPRPTDGEKQEDSDGFYGPAPIEGDPRVPKFSRRQKFVDEILTDQPRVPRAFVNRVWAMLLGRGIVHPFDEMDSMHDASHPELLDWLSEDFAQHNYNIKRLVRGIVLCDAYQLQSNRPDAAEDPADFAWYLEKPLTAEQYFRSLQFVLRGDVDRSAGLINQIREQFSEVLPEENTTPMKNALFLSNNQAFDEFIRTSHSTDHLVPRLVAMESDNARIDTLFSIALGRSPTEDEQEQAIAFLQQKPEAIESSLDDLVWAIVTSAEFRFNH